jgi:carbonic anhydrase
MHMHGPAEHRLDNVQYDLEVHIVHELVGGPEDYKEYHETLAVIGFFF